MSDLPNELYLFRLLCLYFFLRWGFLLHLCFFLYLYLFLCHKVFLLFGAECIYAVRNATMRSLPTLSENTNRHMGTHASMRNPESLFTRFGYLQALPVLGLFFTPLLPDLGITMKFVVLLL